MLDVQVSSQLVFGSEGDVASCLADLVRTDVMRLGEMALETCIVSVIDILMRISTQMTRHVLSVYVIDESQVIEEELLAEVTVWMWHDLSMLLVSNVAVFNMSTKLLNVI